MATAFRRKGSRIVNRMTAQERGLVLSLLRQTRDLLEPAGPEPSGDVLDDLEAQLARRPASTGEVAERDPALQRLLPPASRDDDELAQEFRELTEDALRRRKTATLATAVTAMEAADGRRLELDDGQARALMIALTDVRLVLGERLDLRTDEDSERVHAAAAEAESLDDPVAMAAALYDFTTWLQESLAQALTR